MCTQIGAIPLVLGSRLFHAQSRIVRVAAGIPSSRMTPPNTTKHSCEAVASSVSKCMKRPEVFWLTPMPVKPSSKAIFHDLVRLLAHRLPHHSAQPEACAPGLIFFASIGCCAQRKPEVIRRGFPYLVAKRLQLCHERRSHLVCPAVSAVEFFFGKIRIQSPVDHFFMPMIFSRVLPPKYADMTNIPH
jgi:hypothetical protein